MSDSTQAMSAPRSIIIEYDVDAPRERVFDAWVNPDDIPHWCIGSEGWTVPFAETDRRSGGIFRIGMAGPGGEPAFTVDGVYSEFVPSERLTMLLGDGRPVPITFEDRGGKTHVTLELTLEDENSAEQQREGWTTMIRNLDRYLGTR